MLCSYFTILHQNDMKDKIKLFIDFDETMTLSIKQFVKVANNRFNLNKDWKRTKCWNFTDIYPNIEIEDINSIFRSDEFFIDLEPHENMIKTLNMVKDDVDINIATIGLKENLIKKEKWIKENLKNIDINFIGILDCDGNAVVNKSSIDMSDSIFIDDRIDNLIQSNAKLKILYKDYRHYPWQDLTTNQDIYIVNSWDEIYDIIIFFINHIDMLYY